MRKIAIYTTMLISGMLVPHLNAQPCFNFALSGQYSFEASGTFAGMPFAAAGQTIYHGDGTADGVIQVSALGTVFPAAPWTATYTLGPMQTGGGSNVCVLNKTLTVPNYGPLTVSFFGTAGDGFNELRFIVTAACKATAGTAANAISATVSGTAKKQ
jgi:hypothetical protein